MKKKYIILIYIMNIFFIENIYPQIYLGSHHIIHKEGNKRSEDKNKWKSETKKDNTFYRNLKFDLKFDDNCEYILPEPYYNEQLYKQKVVTLCTSQNGDGKNSLRIGWCYNDKIDKIQLAFYAHINHLEGIYGNEPGREHCFLKKDINSNEWCHVEMAIGKKGMFMSIDGQAVIVSRNIYSWSPSGEKTYVRAFSFFEYGDCDKGDCYGAVQNMDMYIDNAYADLPNFVWENENCEYTADSIAFMNTHFEFASQGPYSYYAGTRIYCSNKSSSTPTNLPFDAPFTVIEPNINVSFYASESISLNKGFHAKTGSNFHARIQQVIQPENIYVLEMPKYITDPVCYTVQNANTFYMELYDWETMNILLDECQGPVIGNQACCNIGEELPSGKYWAVATFSNWCNSKIEEHVIKKLSSDNINYKYMNITSENTIQNIESSMVPRNINSNTKSFTIYPNPHPGTFNVELYNETINEFTIEITNMMGTRVYYRDNLLPGLIQIDISDQATGIYFVKIQAGDKSYLEKVVYR